jgi:hypothetical protein
MSLVTGGLLGPKIVTGGLGVAATGAGSIFWSGPVAGTTGQPSTVFSVAQDSLSGPDTVTPHTNNSGTFTPTSVLLGPGSGAQTFTYTADVDGIHIISITDSLGATIVGGPVTYTATAGVVAELEPAIVAALKGSPELAAICGNRIYPSRIPQLPYPSLPALAYQIATIDRVMHLRGAAGLRRVAVEFECRSLIKEDNRDAREVIRLLFQGFIGTLGNLRVKFVTLDDESDEYEQPTPGSDDGTYTKTFTFTFVVREVKPVFV